jgi:catechol 2,3-dioxygenase-like lactoylglutathione lyase family enzyme
MLEKVSYTSVLVNDQDKALDFYTNVLGLEKAGREPDARRPAVSDRRRRGDGVQLVLWPGTPGKAELEFPWGYVVQFEDPDGNRLLIREGR